jgi:hypothetical protein
MKKVTAIMFQKLEPGFSVLYYGKKKVMRISRQPFPVKIMIDQKQLENVGKR